MSDSDAKSVSSSSNRVPNVDKNVLRKFIHHAESHNRNQEEQEMWKKHFSSKRTNLEKCKPESSSSDCVRARTPKKRKRTKKDRQEKKKKRKKRKSVEEKSPDSNYSKARSVIDRAVEEFLKPKVEKWGHDGYHEIYKDDPGHLSSSSENLERYVEKFSERKRTKLRKKVKITSVMSENGGSETKKYTNDKGEPRIGIVEKRKKFKKTKKSKTDKK